MWDPPPVLFLRSEAPPLRIFFAYLAYHAATETYPIDAHLAQLRPTDHVFLFLTWHRLGFDGERLRQYRRFPCQVILCANTPDEHAALQAAGVHSIYFNHNATLDERIFCITETAVAAALNRSMLGGVFSAEEGTCWASTESLLCGLPVVSTLCSGGRELWYNERNRLIVEPTQEAVAEAVQRGIALLESGAFNRQQIRHDALQLVRQFRATLIAEMQRICDQHGVPVDAQQQFTKTFVHKMGLR
ncbi:glycosyl transferase [Chlorella sorokiniana]|uniref:Glycosyl transferase n=1 Tax=Chlorella sorokiniana TaxID=3076 RepID=A0A2P6TFE8_CHLSO|nr:glycosyl transferase [Chlorella sorokiniana]|eukprot:PRW32840.1 glycosyl transferase [Chlorella sorokiniana]